MKERRNYPRKPVEIPAFYFYPEDLSHAATVINISAGGFCFYAQRSLPMGSAVELAVMLKPNEEIKLKVKTAWSKKIGDTGDYMIGVKISDTSGPDLERFRGYHAREVSEFLTDIKDIEKD